MWIRERRKCAGVSGLRRGASGGGVDASVAQKIPNYLAQSILVTLLCCLPLGIPAIVFAAQVNGKVAVGDVEGALNSSRKAKMWCWWALGLGLGLLVFRVALIGSSIMNAQ